MGKPRLLILIRHAQSEGNRNRDIHQTVPDHRVKLTSEGWQQAYDAGRRLRKMLRADDTLHFFTSPYRRTRETTEGILATLTSDEPEPSPFKRNNIKVYEEPRLREQDFGNFQPCSAEMERMWQERADYGHFFYRIPNGESAADAYDRVSGFNESLWRQFGEDDFASVCVLVTHGLMSRVFLMKWYHFSVEYFEDLRNVNHCEFLIMRKNDDSGKYILQNKLRTWSELKRERAALKEKGEKGDEGTIKDKEKEKDKDKEQENGHSKDSSTLSRALSSAAIAASTTTTTSSLIENHLRRRWGGCPNGCNHDKSFKIRQTLADLVKSDSITSDTTGGAAGASKSGTGSENGSGSSSTGTITNGNNPGVGDIPSSSASTATGPHAHTHAHNHTHNHTHGVVNPSFNGTANSHTVCTGSQIGTIVSRRPAAKRFQSLGRDANGENEDESSGHDTPRAAPDPATAMVIPSISPSGPQIDVTKAREEVVSSPDGTPSFISVDDRLRNHLKSPASAIPPPRPLDHLQLHVGRDFGGTYSGHNSVVASDADSSEDDDHRRHMLRLSVKETVLVVSSGAVHLNGNGSGGAGAEGKNGNHHLPKVRDQSRMGRGARANRLGDHPHSSDGEHEADGEHEHDHDHDHDDEEGKGVSIGDDLSRTLTDEADDALLRRAEREDRSIQGSVY